MLNHARDCLAGRNLSGLLKVCADLRQDQILDLLESALRSKKEWAWPQAQLVEHHTSVLNLASVHGHTQCFNSVFKDINWDNISEDIGRDLITRCATYNHTHGFLKLAQVIALDGCGHIAKIAVRRNNPEILKHILTHSILTNDEQCQSVVAAIEMEHEACLDVLLPHMTHVVFDVKDIRNMMHHVGAPADLFEKIVSHFTKDNFNTILRFACVDGNEDVLEFAFPYAHASKVLNQLTGDSAHLLQERINQAQKDRILQKVNTKLHAASSRKM